MLSPLALKNYGKFSVDKSTRSDTPLTGNPFDPDQRGWLIGIGGQFTVHDIGQGRVAKIPNSQDGTRHFVGGWGPRAASIYHKHQPLPVKAYQMAYAVPHILRLAKRYPHLFEILAKPIASDGLGFTQDKVEPLENLMNEGVKGIAKMSKTTRIIVMIMGVLLLVLGVGNIVDDSQVLVYDLTAILSGIGFIVISKTKG